MTTIPVAPDMTDWTDESAWAGTRAPLRQSTGLNPSAYVDERFFALEQELVFERAWVTVGLAGEVAVVQQPRPGDVEQTPQHLAGLL